MIAIASDHRGYKIKEEIKKYLDEKEIKYKDFGTDSEERMDYPVTGQEATKSVQNGECDSAILICGTGLGMSILANKFKGIRCTVCCEETTAKYAKLHNNSNVLALGAECLTSAKAIAIVRIWIATQFEGGRHQERLNMIEKIENENFK